MAKTSTITETFASAPSIPGAKWSSASGNSVAGGQLTLTTPNTSSSYLATVSGLDLTNSYMGFQLISGPTADVNADVELQIIKTSSNAPLVTLAVYNSTVILRYWNGAGSQADVSSPAYAGSPRYVAVGLDGNLLKWFVSSDSSTWTLLGSKDVTTIGRTTADYTDIYGGVVTNGFGGSGHASAVVDNFNVFSAAPFTTAFTVTSYPSITGTAAAGNTLTRVAGSYAGTVTSRTYRWLHDGHDTGVTGTTYALDETDGSRRVTLQEVVTGPSGTSTFDSSNYRFFPAMKLPWKTTGNPYHQDLPVDVAIDSAMTSTLQGYLTSAYATKSWSGEGALYGPGYTEYLVIVDSSMPRQVFDLAPVPDYSGTPIAPVKNGGLKPHMAWCFATKNGGLPTPPGGFKVADGTDAHMMVYCHDTHELWAGWSVDLTDFSNPRFWYGCYIPDITQFTGYFQDLFGGSEGYAPGTVDEYQYAGWGEQAVNMTMTEGYLNQRELLIDEEIDHAVGIVIPSSNSTARWPNTRAEGGGVGSLPLGGIWQVDPDFDPSTLTTLGSANLDSLRLWLIDAFQRKGAIPIDTTANQGFAIRFEGLNYAEDTFQWGDVFTYTLDALMRSIPVTAWRMVSASYRPTGGPQLPDPIDITTRHFLPSEEWTIFGGTIDGTGRMSLGAYGGDGGQCYTDMTVPLTVDEKAVYVSVEQFAKTTRWQIRSMDVDQSYMGFEMVGTSLKAICFYNGVVQGSTTTVSYSAINHRWQRITVSGGNIIWEGAPDSGTGVPGSWTTIRTLAVPGTFFDLDRCYLYIQALGDTIGVSEGTTVTRNLNQIPAPIATSAGWVVGVA